MALTKTEAAKLTQDLMTRGVIDTIVKDSQLLAMLPFQQVVGTAVTYNREATNPAAAFYDVGDTWAEATPTFTQVTAALMILGGDADVDNFLGQTYADPNDLEAEVLMKRAKATAYLYSERYRTQSTHRAAPLDRPGCRRDRGSRGLARLRAVAEFAVRVVAALATVRAADAWVVRLGPVWQLAAVAAFAIAAAWANSRRGGVNGSLAV